MDVENSNDVGYQIYLKNIVNTVLGDNFSMETYFVWFSALIFITELVTDLCLVTYYIHQEQLQWGLITFAIIILPLMLCQLYSLLMLRTQKNVDFSVLLIHLALMGIPFRYQTILKKVDKDKMSNQELDSLKQMLNDVNNLQAVNAIFQYCPQFLFQAYLIVYKKYKCVITGVSAGLAGFSFLWHIFIHFYYCIKNCNVQDHNESINSQMIDNISSSQNAHEINARPDAATLNPFEKTNLTENIKIFEKPMYKTDDKNLVSKKQPLKNVEKSKIFGFNKRKTVYETEDFDLYDYNNTSTVFFEINESQDSQNKNNLNSSIISNKTEDFHNENNVNLSLVNRGPIPIAIAATASTASLVASSGTLNSNRDHPSNDLKLKGEISDGGGGAGLMECKALKRKGICSSQEMLNLVDLMNDIPAEQVDILAKSLVEMGGDESLKTDSENADSSKLLEQFPEVIDEKLMETVDAAIYENQIIFQERIRKNKLTIQNLKLQDQLLSKYLEEVKNLPSSEMVNIRDYENMCFANVSRQNRLKHWRNYLQDIDTNLHDNSTVQNSSFYVNTMSNSLTDLYVNSTDVGSVVTEDGKLSDQISLPLTETSKKCVRWSDKLMKEDKLNVDQVDNDDDDDDDNAIDNLYINMTGPGANIPRKNILVETINAISIQSPCTHVKNKSQTLPDSIIDS